ncbi:MAG: hypothetical protein R3F29_09230 [Planctomycetota bacterium]
MATPDDISDMFDDDLTRSIAEGDKGPWAANQAQFVDPSLKALEAELAGTRKRDYRERRMEELKRRGDDAGPKAPRAPKKPAPAAAASPAWGDKPFTEPGDALFADAAASPASELTPPPAAPASATAEPASTGHEEPDQERRPSHLAPFAIAVANALLVIGAATAAHALLTGWQPLLALRAVAVATVTGLLWQHFRTGRLRATAIAACAYTAGFLPSEQIGRIEHILALFLGLFAVVAGAALLGDRRPRF